MHFILCNFKLLRIQCSLRVSTEDLSVHVVTLSSSRFPALKNEFDVTGLNINYKPILFMRFSLKDVILLGFENVDDSRVRYHYTKSLP